MDNQPQVGQLDGDDLQLDVTVVEPDPFDAGIKVVCGRVAGVGSSFDHVQDVGGRRSGCLRADCANLMSCTPPLCRTNGSDASLRTGRACVCVCVWSVSVDVLRMLANGAVLGLPAGGRRLCRGEVLSEAAGAGGEMVLLGDFT